MRAEQLRDDLAGTIARVGWAVSLVGPCAEDSCPMRGSRHCFTVGLWKSYGHPELLCIGLRLEVSGLALNLLGQGVKDGRPVPQHGPVSGLLEGFSVRFRPVAEAAVRRVGVGAAVAFYGERLPPFLQLVYPDRAGRFPEDPEVYLGLLAQQPLLALRAVSRLSRLVVQPPVRLRHRCAETNPQERR